MIEQRDSCPPGTAGAKAEQALVVAPAGPRVVQKLPVLAPGFSTEQRQGSSITLQVELPTPWAEQSCRVPEPPAEQFRLFESAKLPPKVLHCEGPTGGRPLGMMEHTPLKPPAEQRPPGTCPGVIL